MRVLHVDTSRQWRGGQTQLLHLARATREDCAVALPPDAPLRAALEDASVTVHPLPFRGSLRGTRRLAALVDRVDPDLVAAHTAHAHHHGLFAGRPLVVHRRLDFAIRPLSRLRYRRAHGFVAVSRAVARVLEQAGVPRERVAVVHDGVDVRRFLHAPRSDLRRRLGLGDEVAVVGAVGALVDHKAHHVLIEAVAALLDSGASVHAVILGEGPLRDVLQRRARQLGVGDRVHLPGRSSDVPGDLAALDLFVHPSVEEGMGQAVVEAMLAGVPVVASRAGGLPDVVQGYGRLVPPGDVAALARGIRQSLRDPLPVAPAREHAARRFSLTRLVRDTLRVYGRVEGVVRRGV